MISLMVMSGVDDGLVIDLHPDEAGQQLDGAWVLTIGRRDEHDVTLRNDSFISRDHAELRYADGAWTLVDRDSKNGTFIETPDDDLQVRGAVPLQVGQLFRIGRTWLRLQGDN